MSDRGNVVLLALASALAGAKLQDIVKHVVARRGGERSRKANQGGSSVSERNTVTPTKPKSGINTLTPNGVSDRVGPVDSNHQSEDVVCPRCDSSAGVSIGKPNSISLHNGSNTKKPDPYEQTCRSTYLSWDDYFMHVAFLSAQRSKDPNKQVGAVIVSSQKIICGVGYNGFPRGCQDDSLPWAKKSLANSPMDTKYPYVCHAEMNAIMNKNSETVQGASLYVTMYPCNECAKLIIQSGISEVVYFEGKDVGVVGVGESMGITYERGITDETSAADATSADSAELEPPPTPLPRSRPELSPASESTSTPTRGGVRPNPTYAAAGKLLKLANVRIRQHTPQATVDVTYG